MRPTYVLCIDRVLRSKPLAYTTIHLSYYSPLHRRYVGMHGLLNAEGMLKECSMFVRANPVCTASIASKCLTNTNLAWNANYYTRGDICLISVCH